MGHRHLPLDQRKVLALRLLFIRELAGLPAPGSRNASRRVWSECKGHVATQVEYHDPEETRFLDNFITTLGRKVEALVRPGVPDANDPTARTLDRFIQTLVSFRCADCAGQEERICPGDFEAANLEGKALCIEPLKDCFHLIVEMVRAVYQEAVASEPEDVARLHDACVEFSTSFVRPNNLSGLFSNGHVSAETEWQRENAVVVLVIKVDLFDELSYQQVPYLLAHELICHAFQGRPPDGKQVDFTCAWSEAWMDCVAMYALEEFLTNTDRLHSFCRPFSKTDMYDAASQLAAFRRTRESGIPRAISEDRVLVHRVFCRLMQRFSYESAQDAMQGWRLMRSMSLMINRISLTQEARAALIDDLLSIYDPHRDHPSPETPRQAAILSLIRGYVAGAIANADFLHALSAIVLRLNADRVLPPARSAA